jgi:hypothetical protein
LKHRWDTIKKEVSLFVVSTRMNKGGMKVVKLVMIR